MRILVLGGSVFLGRAIAECARDDDHHVSCLARGASGPLPAGTEHVVADRDRPGAYDAVRGREWDAVVEVSWQPDWVRSALAVLAERARHWTYVSSCSVYASQAEPGADESAALVGSHTGPRATREEYGAAKVACEQACRDALAARLHISRAGLLAGPDDRSDRVGYWPGRFARGGDVLVPAADGPVQLLDVRDLAAFVLHVAVGGDPLVANAVGVPTTLRPVLVAAEDVASAAAPRPVSRVEADDSWLLDQGVEPYMGAESMPLWLPLVDWAGFSARDDTRAAAAGLSRRPLAETLAAALGDEVRLGLDRPRRAGLSAGREAELVSLRRLPG